MNKKLNVAFVYKPCKTILGQTYYTMEYHFIMKALKRNSNIEVTYFPIEDHYNVSSWNNKFDVIFLRENGNTGDICMPNNLEGIQNLNIPVIAKIGDAHRAREFDFEDNHKKFKINAYIGIVTEEYFYKYYPRHYKYKVIHGYGLEPSLYRTVTPYKDRIKNRILNSGNIGNPKIISRIINKILNPETYGYKHYKLRTICNKLSYVDYTPTLQHEYVGDKYPLLLQKYAAAIAASTLSYAPKFLEIPAAGCLTFMEATEKNHAKDLGFKDGETAVFINEKNYKEKFNEYIQDLNNPKWEKIATAGREYVLKNLTNDNAVDSLVDFMQDLIQST